jgi:hypothetical protein
MSGSAVAIAMENYEVQGTRLHSFLQNPFQVRSIVLSYSISLSSRKSCTRMRKMTNHIVEEDAY